MAGKSGLGLAENIHPLLPYKIPVFISQKHLLVLFSGRCHYLPLFVRVEIEEMNSLVFQEVQLVSPKADVGQARKGQFFLVGTEVVEQVNSSKPR